VLECWSVGVLECWSVGVLECWSVGVLECWSILSGKSGLESQACRLGIFLNSRANRTAPKILQLLNSCYS
jgi:hypothetical protein